MDLYNLVKRLLKKLNNPNLLLLLPFAVLILITVLVISFVGSPSKKSANKVENVQKLVKARIYKNEQIKYWEIIDTSKTPPFSTGLWLYDQDSPSPIVKWNNFLIGLNQEYYVDKESDKNNNLLRTQVNSIRIYNMDTGEAFNLPINISSLGGDKSGYIWYVTSQLVDDKYYFGTGGAFGATLAHELDLPPQKSSKIIDLKNPIGNRVRKVGNTYISSFCYEGCTYELFNLNTSTVIPLKRMYDASNTRITDRKEEFIGLNSSGRMILNSRNIPKNSFNQQYFDTEAIISVPLNNENLSTTLLRASDLPEKMFGYLMVDGIDKILMLGESKAYIYDLVQNKFREIKLGPPLWDYLSKNKQNAYFFFNSRQTDKTICFSNNETPTFAIDMIAETFLDKAPIDCQKLYSKEGNIKILNELNLPERFKFQYNSKEYRIFWTSSGILESEVPPGAEIIK